MQNGAWPRRSLPFQVLAAILMVAAATAVTAVLKQYAPQFTFGIYYAAVVLTAYYIGIRAGALTALVAGLVGNSLFVHAGQGLLSTPGEVLQLVTFWAVCAVICALIYMSRRNENRLRERDPRWRGAVWLRSAPPNWPEAAFPPIAEAEAAARQRANCRSPNDMVVDRFELHRGSKNSFG